MRVSGGAGFAAGTLFALVVGGGSAYATTGGTFVLGRSNSAAATTTLANTTGTPLSLTGKSGYPPLRVNSSVKVPYFNADRLDGLDSTSLQRRVTGTCPAGFALRSISATGSVTCDDEQADVADVVTQSTGPYVRANCPIGYVATGGGFLQTADANGLYGFAIGASVNHDPNTGSEYYSATLAKADGSDFTGQMVVTVRCVYGSVGLAANGPNARARAIQR